MTQTSYPTLIESAERYAVLWNKWNIGDIEGDDMLLQLEKEGCFLEEVCKDWAVLIKQPYERVLKANIERFERKPHSSPTSARDEK